MTVHFNQGILELPLWGQCGEHQGREASHVGSISNKVVAHSGARFREALKQEEKKIGVSMWGGRPSLTYCPSPAASITA